MAAQRNLAKTHRAHSRDALHLALKYRLKIPLNRVSYQRLTHRPQHLSHPVVRCVH
jgi:hypothetical protein